MAKIAKIIRRVGEAYLIELEDGSEATISVKYKVRVGDPVLVWFDSAYNKTKARPIDNAQSKADN